MQTKPPYVYGGQTFPSLKAVQDHVMGFLDYYNRIVGVEKFDPVLADVVAERHYIWSHRGIRPTSFQFMLNQSADGRTWADSLAGYFGPEWGWQRFSYRKALRGTPPTLESEFPRLCRERFAKVWRPRLFEEGFCVIRGCTASATDVDHVAPEHKDIVNTCWEQMGQEDQKVWWHTMLTSDGDLEHFGMPEGHPVTVLYDTLTEGCVFQIVCQDHHKAATRGRRNGSRPQIHKPKLVEDNIDFESLF